MSAEKLSIESQTFAVMRETFDVKLNALLMKMVEKGVTDGRITLQVDVHTEQGEAQDPDIPAEQTKVVLIPMFRFKVADAITIKSDHGGVIGDMEHELLYSNGSWMIGKVSDQQTSMFDEGDDWDAED